MKSKLHFLASLLLVTFYCTAQDFQWAKRGGGINSMQRTKDYNNVIEMATDGAGNVYLLGRVSSSGLMVDGNPLATYNSTGGGAAPELLLASFTEEGDYRWSKVIGGGSNNGIGLAVHDGLVHLSGFAASQGTIHFDKDTASPYANNGKRPKGLFLIQYDTAGNFNWLVRPDTDTTAFTNFGGYSYWLSVSPKGEIHWLCDLKAGDLPGSGQPISQRGTYVLKYGQNGQLLGRVKLDVWHDTQFLFRGAYNEGNFLRDPSTGNYYLGGTHDYPMDLLIGGDTIKGSMYLAAFDSTGALLSKKENTTTGGLTSLNDFQLDGHGNLYITGLSIDGAEAFNGLVFSSPTIHSAPYTLKLDSNGNTS